MTVQRATGMTHTHTHTRTYTHLPLCHGHTLSIVTDTHQHIDRGLYTYMTSYFAQAYRLWTLIDKPTLFIDSWLIRLWVDNVLLINTRSLSIVIDKPIPLLIGIPITHSHVHTEYKPPTPPRPRSSPSRTLRSFGLLRVWPGLVPPTWPLDPLLGLLLFLPAQPSVCETFRSLRFRV
jgi:hypothetical protein